MPIDTSFQAIQLISVHSFNFIKSTKDDDGTDESYQIIRSNLNSLLKVLVDANFITADESIKSLREYSNIKKEYLSPTVQKVINFAENFARQL